MPRYFFDLNDDRCIHDDEGRECVDFEAARMLAVKSLPEIAQWKAPSGGDQQTFSVVVRDDADRPVYTMTLTLEGRRLGSMTP